MCNTTFSQETYPWYAEFFFLIYHYLQLSDLHNMPNGMVLTAALVLKCFYNPGMVLLILGTITVT